MRNIGSNLISLGIGLILVVLSVQLLWTILQQYAAALFILFLIGGGALGWHLYKKYKGGRDGMYWK